ncbi:MAG: SDR family oxidoreductase [SAR202 cluster bacterium]|nr:SDR family oxidoreductase [SAR202 cluster bacterium]
MSTARAKTVLITGASSGIGKATALHLAEKGYTVLGTSRSMERLTDLQAQAESSGLRVKPLELDINDDQATADALNRILDEFGPLDALVNNAGYGLWGPVEDLTIQEVRDQFETNFFAALRLIKLVVPGMVEMHRGTIVNISSVEGRLATPFNGAYAASKFALEGLSEALRTELWPFGIRVAVVQPGLFQTQFQQNQVVGEAADTEGGIYTPYLATYRSKHSRYERLATDPIAVAKVVHKVLRSRRPAFRHPVGLEARLGMIGARLIPERIFQFFLTRSTIR